MKTGILVFCLKLVAVFITVTGIFTALNSGPIYASLFGVSKTTATLSVLTIQLTAAILFWSLAHIVFLLQRIADAAEKKNQQAGL